MFCASGEQFYVCLINAYIHLYTAEMQHPRVGQHDPDDRGISMLTFKESHSCSLVNEHRTRAIRCFQSCVSKVTAWQSISQGSPCKGSWFSLLILIAFCLIYSHATHHSLQAWYFQAALTLFFISSNVMPTGPALLIGMAECPSPHF